LKILLTADTAGGVWTYAVELATELQRCGHELLVAAMGREERAADGLHVRFLDCALEWAEDPSGEVERAGEWLLRLSDRFAPDLVHVNGYAHAALDWRVPVVCVSHSDVASWFAAVRGTTLPPAWNRYRGAVEAGLAAADVVVAPTQAQLRSLERHYRFETERVVIPNGRRPLEHLPKQALVAAAGRAWDEAKGIANLERVSVGWPVEVADGSRTAAETEALLARAAIFAAPARYEPFGLAALEAATTGAALVLGDIDSLREVWGDAAIYIANERELERALCRLIGDGELRRKLGELARLRARRFSPGRMVDAYLRLYERLPALAAA
jgi:glycogen(starch) synthase